jgi:hypothetical protein
VSTGEISTLIAIAVGMMTLMAAFVRAIYKIANVVDTMKTLSDAVTKLADRVNTLDQRMYEIAVRGPQKR